jgi:hypothetical protein
LRHVAAGAVALRADLRELADGLSESGDAARKKAQTAATDRSVEDRVDLVRDLVRRLRLEPQRQNDYGESIGILARTSPVVAAEAVNLLRDIDVSAISAALPIRLVVDVNEPTPALVQLLREWLPSERLPARARRAIEQIVGEGAVG